MKLLTHFIGLMILALTLLITADSTSAEGPFGTWPPPDFTPPENLHWANQHIGQIVHWEGTGNPDAWNLSVGGRASYDAIGSRHQSCDDQDFLCTPGTPGCCFRPLGRVTVQLWSSNNGVPEFLLGSAEASDNGSFQIKTEPAYSEPAIIRVRYENNDERFPVTMRDQTIDPSGVSVYTDDVDILVSHRLDNGDVWYEFASVNEAGEDWSGDGHAPMAWQSIQLASNAIFDEGELGIDTGERYLIDYAGLNDSLCWGGADRTCAGGKYIRNWDMIHEFGHSTSVRILGGGITRHTYGVAHNWGKLALESAPINEAYAGVVEWLTRFNPNRVALIDLARGIEMDATIGMDFEGFCADTSGYDHVNDVAVDRNAAAGLWEFIDRDTSSTDTGADVYDLTFKDLNDAFLEWQSTNGVSGQNRTKDEHFLGRATGRVCEEHEDCRNNEWCINSSGLPRTCHKGGGSNDDTQGENVRDWVDYLPDPSENSGRARNRTLQSSPCVGPRDNSFPYQGGFRGD